MSRSKKYFYLSSLMIILSFFFNTNNVFLSGLFNSFIKLILFCSVINSIVLILSIIFADRSIKSLKPDADWIRIASKFALDYSNCYFSTYLFNCSYIRFYLKKIKCQCSLNTKQYNVSCYNE